jgi:hypothetical protein
MFLIASLIGQLAFSYQCCGITILCECLAWTSECSRAACASDQCASEASSCCATMASCGSSCDIGAVDAEGACGAEPEDLQPCGGADCAAAPAADDSTPVPAGQQCTPIDPKAPRSPEGLKSVIDFFHLTPAMLHPAIAAPIHVERLQPHNDRPIQPQFKSNHQRQASLEVWLN